MDTTMYKKLRLYQATVIFSVLFALIGFSYNVWRMEASEENNNIRTACFEILINLSSLEQLVYSAHYDKDLEEGNPRKGWVTVGLVVDLSALTDDAVREESATLKKVWSNQWSAMASNRDSVEKIVASIDSVRAEIKTLLNSLE
ncbi:MAG: hypothetical protein KJN89_04445 [Gammaproteobacteria bacterium]|nr:hypothetical protein [Gammaproteobacteria bacterium]NNJ49602.1 hypothetical protein [Gammaproteobacteria bacterium]